MRQLRALVFLAFVSACSSALHYNIAVSGLGSGREAATYIILSMMKDIDSTDLQFQEARKYLVAALSKRGFKEASSPQSADLAVFLAYGIGAPETHSYAYSMPVFGQTAGGTTSISATTTGTGGTATTTGTVTTAPQFGIVGARTIAGQYTTYTRFAIVSAVDLSVYRSSQQIKEAWRTVTVSSGSSGDLRLILPILFAGGGPYLGTNTGRAILLTLKADDPRITEMRTLP
jgi:hypothetical protein